MMWTCNICLVTTNPMSSIKCLSCEAFRPDLTEEEIQRIEEQKKKEKEDAINKFRGGSSTVAPTGFTFSSTESSEQSTPQPTGFTFGFQPSSSDQQPPPTTFSFGFAPELSPVITAGGFVFGAAAPPADGSDQTTSTTTTSSSTTGPSGFGFSFSKTPQRGTLSPKKVAEKPELSQHPIGSVYVHGSGECEQLGLGDGVLERKKPTLIKSINESVIDYLKNQSLPTDRTDVVQNVFSGSLHSAVLTAEGTVLTWGCNDDGALGRKAKNGENPENQPSKIELEDVRIVDCSLGDCHSCFLTDDGDMFICGSYRDSSGYLGFMAPGKKASTAPVHTQKQIEPVKMIFSGKKGEKVVQISSGANHTLALVAVPKRAGLSPAIVGSKLPSPSSVSPKSSNSPADVHMRTPQKAPVTVPLSPAPKSNHNPEFASTTLYVWGNDEFGQLGLGERSSLAVLTETEAFELKHLQRTRRRTFNKLAPRAVPWDVKGRGAIVAAWCSGNCTFIQTDRDEIYGCGLNNMNQLGSGDSTLKANIPEFVKVSALAGKGVVSIRGSSFHAAALTEHGHVYCWGRGDYCGLNRTDDVRVPTKVEIGVEVKGLAVGGSHVICCDAHGDVWTWGFGETNQLGNIPRRITGDKASNEENDKTDEPVPYRVDSKQLSDKFVFAVAAGSQHSVELAWQGRYVSDLVNVPERKEKMTRSVKKDRQENVVMDTPAIGKKRARSSHDEVSDKRTKV